MSKIYPEHLERQYERFFSNIIKIIGKDLKKRLLPQLEKDLTVDSQLLSLQKAFKEFDVDFRSIQGQVEDALDELLGRKQFRKKLKRLFGLIDAWTIAKVKSQISISKISSKKKILEGIILDRESPLIVATLDKFIETNKQLIKTLGKEYIQSVSDDSFKVFVQGGSRKDLADSFKALTDNNIHKAKFWARDQTSSAFSALNEQRQTAAGIIGYIWRTVGDNKVRGNDPKDKTSHVILEGRFFTWARGAAYTGQISKPGGKHPGDDYNDRCYPEPAMEPKK